MSFITVGLSHRTTPSEVREEFTLDELGAQDALQHLSSQPPIDEVVLLSTCNRTEVYVLASDTERALDTIVSYLSSIGGYTAQDLETWLYTLSGVAVLQHLMRVACGLDSQILGEPQILGQVSQALLTAQRAGTAGTILSHLFTSAVRAGKRARSETAISRHTTSTSHAAVLLAQNHVTDLEQAKVLVIGAGEMAQLAIDALDQRKVGAIGCINRTFKQASAVIERLRGPTGRGRSGTAFNWYHLGDALTWADVVIAATGAPHTVVHAEEVEEILPHRRGRTLVFVDIALPNDVERCVDTLPGVFRYDLDHLHAKLDENLTQRRAEVPKVGQIIAEETESFANWYNSRRTVPVLVGMRRTVKEIARQELEETLAGLDGLTGGQEADIQRMVHRIVNKILHEPTVQLKEAAAESPELGDEYAQVIQALFGLSETAAPQEREALLLEPALNPESLLVDPGTLPPARSEDLSLPSLPHYGSEATEMETENEADGHRRTLQRHGA